MDPAQAFEASLLERLKPINELAKLGTSPIQQFYRGKTVLLTGGTGFLGKQLIEKIFRSCDIKKLYLLIRPKKGKTVKERVETMFKDIVYDTVWKQNPNFLEKVEAVEGDIGELKLGLSDKDWEKLKQEVNIIIHSAATIRFDEPLRKAAIMNVRGTREVLQLARECSDLLAVTYVSTAYTHTTESRINKEVLETYYPCPLSPQQMIELVDTLEEDRLDKMTPGLISGWPNTYSFTKALAEDLIRQNSDIPVCIVKPTFVVNSQVEPAPGWIDLNACMSGPIGLALGTALGLCHLYYLNPDVELSFVPVDMVNNTILAAPWDMMERKKEKNEDKEYIYIVTTYGQGKTWLDLYRYFKHEDMGRLNTPKSIWYAFGYYTNSKLVYQTLSWPLHYIPAYLADGLLDILKVRPKGIPPLVKVYKRVDKVFLVYKYFLFHDWHFKDQRFRSMIKRMSAEDKVIFNCNVKELDIYETTKTWAIGVRRYIIKDGLENSVYAYKKQKWLAIPSYLTGLLYLYLLWKILCFVFCMLRFIFNF